MLLRSLFIAGISPTIHNVSSNEMATVTVNWSAENADDIESLQLSIASNTEEETHTTCVTDKENTEMVVRTTLEPGNYLVTLTAIDICGENFNSKSLPLNIPEPKSISVPKSTVSLKPTPFHTPVTESVMNCVCPGTLCS